MATSSRQSALFGVNDWKAIFTSTKTIKRVTQCQ